MFNLDGKNLPEEIITLENEEKLFKWLEVVPHKGLWIKPVDNVLSCVCGFHPLPAYAPLLHQPDVSLSPNEILVTGLGRSASTVVWQVANLLEGGKVAKSHNLLDSCPALFKFKKVLITVRHPFDHAYSLKKTNGDNFLEIAQKEWDIIRSYYMLSRLQDAIDYRPDLQITFIRYEDFWNKDEERIKYLAHLLEKSVSLSKVQNILSKTSIEKNLERSANGDLDRKININHVDHQRGRPGQGADLDLSTKNTVAELAGPAFDIFGYENS